MKNKFRAIPSYDLETGMSFDSRGEERRWRELEMLERGGVISELVFKPKPIVLDAEAGIKWGVDYSYVEDGRPVWEDFKPRPSTQAERLLMKLWKAHGPGLLRITGWRNNRGYVIRKVMTNV